MQISVGRAAAVVTSWQERKVFVKLGTTHMAHLVFAFIDDNEEIQDPATTGHAG